MKTKEKRYNVAGFLNRAFANMYKTK